MRFFSLLKIPDLQMISQLTVNKAERKSKDESLLRSYMVYHSVRLEYELVIQRTKRLRKSSLSTQQDGEVGYSGSVGGNSSCETVPACQSQKKGDAQLRNKAALNR